MRKTTSVILSVHVVLGLSACASTPADQPLSATERAELISQIEQDRLDVARHKQRESLMRSQASQAAKASDQKAQVPRPRPQK